MPSLDISVAQLGNLNKTVNSNFTQDSVGTEFNNTRYSTSSWIVKTLQGEDYKVFKSKKKQRKLSEDDKIIEKIRQKEKKMYGFKSKMKS